MRVEMTGMAVGQPDLHARVPADLSPHRFLSRAARHHADAGTSPLLGCTAFAAMGGRGDGADRSTDRGPPDLGRQLRLEGPPIFDTDKAVLFFRPSDPGKLPFASGCLGWHAGVVTGR